MQVHISEDYESLSKKCADDLLSHIYRLKNPVICTASGDTPKGMYKELIKTIQEKPVDVSQWHFVSLDEWAEMNGDDEGSCRYHLNKDLFEPLQIKESNIIFFNGKDSDLNKECRRIDNEIKKVKGIDVAILGIGANGHVGMNEPGTDKYLAAHVADIHETTSIAGQKYFQKKQRLTHGLTLGIADLMNAKVLMLVASGSNKAAIIKALLESEETPQLPATLLLKHKNFFIYLDKAAADNL